MLRLICYFALFIVFFAGYRCAPSDVVWRRNIQAIINAASRVEPCEKMKVDIRSILFEQAGRVVKSYTRESQTLIVNEHSLPQDGESSHGNSSETLVYHHFDFRLTNPNSRGVSIFSFWSIQIKSFVYFTSAGSKMKLLIYLMPEDIKGIVTVDFLNPGDAEPFWHYALKNRRRRRTHVVDVLKFEVFNRQTRAKVVESSFAVVHKEWSKRAATTYTISVGSDGVTQKPLLIFLSSRFSISRVIEDRIGLLILDEPNMVFVLQFAPFENDAAFAFRSELFHLQSNSLYPISDNELRSFIV